MTKPNKVLIPVVALVVVILGGWYVATSKGLLPAGGKAAVASSDIVAVVNGENITRTDLTAAEAEITAQAGVSATTTQEKQQLQTQAVNSLVAQKLLEQAAKSAGVTASSTAVDAQIQTAKSQFPSRADYEKELAAEGLTEDSLRAQIATTLAIQDYLERELHLSAVTVSDAEIQDAYNTAAAQQTNVPPLDSIRDQVKQLVLQQKEQSLIDAQVDKLRAAGDVQVLI